MLSFFNSVSTAISKWTGRSLSQETPRVGTSAIDPTNWYSSDEFRVNVYTTDQQLFPTMAPLADGNVMITWSSYGQDATSSWGIFANIIDAQGNKLSATDISVNTLTASNQVESKIIGLKNGNAIVSWATDIRTPNDDIKAQLLDSSGNKIGSEIQINSNANNNQGLTLSELADSRIIITWHEITTNWNAEARIFDNTLNANSTEFMVNAPSPSTLQTFPAALGLSKGGYMVAFDSDILDGSTWDIFIQNFDNQGNKIQSQSKVNTYTTSDQYYPHIFKFNNNETIVTWDSQGQDGSGFAVIMQSLDNNGNKVGNEIQINTYTTGDQAFYPQISTSYPTQPPGTILDNGNCIIVWSSSGQDGSGWGVYAQRFDAQKNKLGPEFRVNDFTTYDQATAVVAPLNNGKVAIAWSSGQDEGGTSNNIYMKIMGPLTFSLDSQLLTYQENKPLLFTDLFIDSPRRSVTLTLTLDDPHVGILTAAPTSKVIPIYNTVTGQLQISGFVDDINQALSNLKFIPTKNKHKNFSINYMLQDDKSNTLTGKVNIEGERKFNYILGIGLLGLGIVALGGTGFTAYRWLKAKYSSKANKPNSNLANVEMSMVSQIGLFGRKQDLEKNPTQQLNASNNEKISGTLFSSGTAASTVVQVRSDSDVKNILTISPKDPKHNRELQSINTFFQPKSNKNHSSPGKSLANSNSRFAK